MRKRLLFRYEIGLSFKAIATIFNEDIHITQNYMEEAERELHEGLENAGCRKRFSLESIYRETRSLKPPLSWDQEVLSAYPDWVQNGVPEALLRNQRNQAKPNLLSSMKTRIRNRVSLLRSDLGTKMHGTSHSIT